MKESFSMYVKKYARHAALFSLLLLTAALAISCSGGDEGDTAATAKPSSPAATAKPSSPAAATAKPTSTNVPAPSGPAGKVVVGLDTVAPLVQHPRKDINATGGIGQNFSVYENIVKAPFVGPPSPPPQDSTKYSPSDQGIAESWVIAPDLSSITFKIRSNIPWHDNGGSWGFVTAEDVAWTYNEAFALDSVSNGAEEIGDGMKAGFEVVDSMTVRQNIKPDGFDPTWAWLQGNAGFNGIVIVNKKAFDELGEELYASTPIGTGRYQANEWIADDKVELEAVVGHWTGKDANVKNITILSMPEAATREAALRTGEIDIAQLPAQVITSVVEAIGGTVQEIGIARPQGLQMAGNYWSQKCSGCDNGVMERPGFDTAISVGLDKFPWIGNPADPASMESARKVRWALAMTVDQQSIIDNILDGRGRVNYAWENILPNDPTHKDSWVIPYDTDKARQFMAEAGYPDGFDMEMWNYSNGSPGTISAANAVAAAWRTELGIEVSIDGTEYGARRPQTVDKSINVPFVHGINWIPGSTSARYICPGQGQVVGFTMDDEQCDLGLSNATESSLEVRIDNNIANQDYLTEWMLFVPMFQAPAILFVVSPNIESWTPYNAQDVLPNNLESMTLK